MKSTKKHEGEIKATAGCTDLKGRKDGNCEI